MDAFDMVCFITGLRKDFERSIEISFVIEVQKSCFCILRSWKFVTADLLMMSYCCEKTGLADQSCCYVFKFSIAKVSFKF
ncbi:hypothetical protein ACS0TY_021972 [Phlomoides rotata]